MDCIRKKGGDVRAWFGCDSGDASDAGEDSFLVRLLLLLVLVIVEVEYDREGLR